MRLRTRWKFPSSCAASTDRSPEPFERPARHIATGSPVGAGRAGRFRSDTSHGGPRMTQIASTPPQNDPRPDPRQCHQARHTHLRIFARRRLHRGIAEFTQSRCHAGADRRRHARRSVVRRARFRCHRFGRRRRHRRSRRTAIRRTLRRCRRSPLCVASFVRAAPSPASMPPACPRLVVQRLS